MTQRVNRKCSTVLQVDQLSLQIHTYALTLATSESSDSVRHLDALAVFRRPKSGIANRTESSGEIAE